jgi:DegV family protein with EDD domain
MSIKVVSDSSSNVFAVEGLHYATVPMKVIAAKEYIDTPELDLQGMVTDLQNHKGKSGSSCPNVQEWLDAFGTGDDIFALTISKNLSGSYNAAKSAAEEYVEANPGKKAFVFDSLAAGPQQIMIAEKIKELINAGYDYETIKEKTLEYHNHTHILFCLESLTNLARNGRVSPAVAKIAGVLGMRVVGDVKGGQITPVHKPRGHKKAMQTLVEMLEERGLYDGALIRIAHCFGESQANDLKALVQEKYPNVRFVIEPTTALCSFYAEAGGLMIGFEGGYNKENNNKDF